MHSKSGCALSAYVFPADGGEECVDFIPKAGRGVSAVTAASVLASEGDAVPSLYVSYPYVERFYRDVLPSLRGPIVLITSMTFLVSCCDRESSNLPFSLFSLSCSQPYRLSTPAVVTRPFGDDVAAGLLRSDKIKAWFTTNPWLEEQHGMPVCLHEA